jgi:hypothetical protein
VLAERVIETEDPEAEVGSSHQRFRFEDLGALSA